jgi:hypothetical protein
MVSRIDPVAARKSDMASQQIDILREYLTPKETLRHAKVMLQELIEADYYAFNAGELEAPQATERHVKAAYRQLKGLSTA